MTTARNGSSSHRSSTRRLRFDASMVRPTVTHRPGVYPAYSGRRFITVGVLSVLILWGLLYLAFRDWRERYRERAAFGKNYVATAIDPLAKIIPPGTDP